MAQVAIQLSDDDMERLKAHAVLNEISPEDAAAEAVMDLLNGDDPLLGFADEAGYRAFVQEGIDSADRGELEDWDVVKADIRSYMAERLAATSK